MKTNILVNIRVLAIAIVCLTVLGVGNTRGSNWSYTFSATPTWTGSGDSRSMTVSSATWSVSTSNESGSPSTWGTYGSAYSSGGIKFGDSGSNYYGTTTLSTDYFSSSLVSSVTVNLLINGSKTTTITVTQGVTIGSPSYGTGATWHDFTANTNTGTGGTLTLTITTTQAIYIHSISVTYTAATPRTVTFNKQGGTFDDPSVFINTNQIREESGGAGVTLPLVNPSSSCASEGWGFYGWATSPVSSSTTTAPTIVGKAGDTYHPSSDIPLYAVFAQGEYTKETSAITSGAKYLIVANSTKNYVMTDSYSLNNDDRGEMASAQIDETSSGKYSAASVDAQWCFTIEASSTKYYIRDVKHSSSNNYMDIAFLDWYGNTEDGDDKYTLTLSAGKWKIENDYSYFYFNSTDHVFTNDPTNYTQFLLYKAGTINYYSNPSCCNSLVTVSAGTSSTNGSITTITGSPVATCNASAANRTVTITVSPNTGYVAPDNLDFSVTSGTAVTATKESGPTNNVYVYSFAQDDNNSTCKVNVACVGKQCALVFDQNGGTGGQSSNLTATYGSAMPTISGVPTRDHYDFLGYYDGTGNNATQYYTNAGASARNWDKNTTSNTTLYAKWTEHSLTRYRTSCCTQYDITLEDDGETSEGTWSASKSKACEGVDIDLSAEAKVGYNFTGWKIVKTGVVPEEDVTNSVIKTGTSTDEDITITMPTPGYGMTVSALFESSGTKRVTISSYSNGTVTVAWNDGSAQSITSGYADITVPATLTISASAATGYSLGSLTVGGNAHTSGNTYNMTNDVTVAATFTPNTDTHYTVKHYKQKLDGTYDETPDDTDNLTGTTGDEVTPARKNYTGFNAPAGQTVTILADGSRVVEYQYTRNSYTLAWSWDGGSTTSTTHTAAGSVAYGTTLVYPADNTMSKTGHAFSSWSPAPATMPAEATTITAQWSKNNYNVAVSEIDGVTITATPAGGSAIAEKSNSDVQYQKTVTLNYSSLDGKTWGGWRVTKASDANVSVTVSGSGNGATFTMPDYAVQVSAFVYGEGIAWCDPDVTVTGDVHLTSYNGVSVNTISGAGNISLSISDMGSSRKMEIGYLDGNNDEVDIDDSPFRLCNNGVSPSNYDIIDGSVVDLDYEWGKSHSIKYTPNAYNQRDNYKLQLKFKRGDKVLKTVTHAIYGRALPEEFVIACKYLGNWYALPNTMGTSAETVTPLKVTVDNTTTPTEVSYAPNTTVYKGAARYRSGRNVNAIRFTSTGSNWLETSSTAQLKLSTTATPTEGVEDKQAFYLNSSTFGAYELAISGKKLGMYNGYMGMYADPAYTSEDIYLLPIGTKYTPVDATATDWTDDAIGVTATVSATKLGIVQQDGTETAPVTMTSSGTSHVVDFNSGIDFTGLTGNIILLKWYDGSTFVGGSEITVPSIIAAGAINTWSALASTPTAEDIVVLSKPMSVNVEHAVANKIVIDQSGSNTGKLSIQPNKGLEVSGTVKAFSGSAFGSTGESDIVLESSSAGNASLIFDNSTGDKATVAMYSKGSIDGETWNWQFIGMPFTTTNALYSYYGSYIYQWVGGDWTEVPNGGTMEPFAGYCITQDAPTTYVMDGTLNPTTEQSISVPASQELVIGNSWTAPIFVSGFTNTTLPLTNQTIYLFNTGYKPKDQGPAEENTGDRFESGTYVTIPIHSAPYTGNDLIAPMQGFYVDNTSGSAATITLNYNDLVRPQVDRSIVAGPLHAPKRERTSYTDPDVMKIWINGSVYNDKLILLAREDFSIGFDNGWDGKKQGFGVVSPSVYTLNNIGEPQAVSAIPTLEGTIVAFKRGTENICTLTFEYDGDDVWYLNDLKQLSSVVINNEQNYMFFADEDGSEVRFIISQYPINSTATGMQGVDSQGDRVQKVLIHDHLYIIHGGRMYSAEGKMVQ